MAELAPVWRTLSHGWISLTGAINPTGLATALLVRHGTDAQRERWLPAIARGDVLASFSITEPQAGSDLGADRDRRARRATAAGSCSTARSAGSPAARRSEVVFMLAEIDGEPSCVVLPGRRARRDGWAVDELDKVGYRGVESAAYRFDGFEAPGAEVLGDDAGRGRAPDARRARRRPRQRRLPRARDPRPLPRVRGRGVDDARGRRRAARRPHARAAARRRAGRAPRGGRGARCERAAAAVDARADDARELSTAAKVVASDTAVWAVDVARRLAASRSYAAGDELARLRRDAPQTQIGEGANDALLLALARPLLRG